MRILYDAESVPTAPLLAQMIQSAEYCIKAEDLNPDRIEISLTFVSAEEIKQLNRTYRGIDEVTDVLSFPQYDNTAQMRTEEGDLLLGDIVICTEQALRQAKALNQTQDQELIYLFTHSICHLLGYDHMTPADKSQMRRQEKAALAHLKASQNG